MNIAQPVKFNGAIVNFGDQRKLLPLAETYIWKKIPYNPEGDLFLYLIQHNQGEPIEFFEKNAENFKTTFNDVRALLAKINVPIKFAYCFENDLTPIVEEKQPVTETPAATEEELKSITDYVEEAILGNDDVPCYNSTNTIDLPLQVATPKPKKVYFVKMDHKFQVEKEDGITQFGKPGDYLLQSHNKKTCSILTEAEFISSFQENKTLISKQIGKNGEVFLLNPTVAEYIEFIENLNTKLRTKKYLTGKQIEE